MEDIPGNWNIVNKIILLSRITSDDRQRQFSSPQFIEKKQRSRNQKQSQLVLLQQKGEEKAMRLEKKTRGMVMR